MTATPPVRSGWTATLIFALAGSVIAFLATRGGLVLRSDDGDRIVSLSTLPDHNDDYAAQVAPSWTDKPNLKDIKIPATSGGVWIGPSLWHWTVVEVRRSGRQTLDLMNRLTTLSWGFIGLATAAYGLGFGLLVRRQLWRRFTSAGYTFGVAATVVLLLLAMVFLPKEPLDGSVTLVRFNGLTLAALCLPLLVTYPLASLDFLEGRRGPIASFCRFVVRGAITAYLLVGMLGWIAVIVLRLMTVGQ